MAFNLTQSCSFRRNPLTIHQACGFRGNPDLYGIGIRLGIYAQWLAAILSNNFLPDYRGDIHSAYFLFSLALTIATLVITIRYGRYCVFFSEIFVLVSLFFGGYFTVHFFKRIGGTRHNSSASWTRGRLITLSIVYGIMISYNCWFWFKGRMTRFQPTPCGTAVFLYAKFSGMSLHKAVAFYMAFSVIMATYYPFGVWLLLQNDPSLSHRLRQIQPESLRRHINWRTNRPLLATTLFFLNAFGFALSVAAIELTLNWNSVSGVNSMSSVGQLIAFTVGTGGLVQVIWTGIMKDVLVGRIPSLAARIASAIVSDNNTNQGSSHISGLPLDQTHGSPATNIQQNGSQRCPHVSGLPPDQTHGSPAANIQQNGSQRCPHVSGLPPDQTHDSPTVVIQQNGCTGPSHVSGLPLGQTQYVPVVAMQQKGGQWQ